MCMRLKIKNQKYIILMLHLTLSFSVILRTEKKNCVSNEMKMHYIALNDTANMDCVHFCWQTHVETFMLCTKCTKCKHFIILSEMNGENGERRLHRLINYVLMQRRKEINLKFYEVHLSFDNCIQPNKSFSTSQ